MNEPNAVNSRMAFTTPEEERLPTVTLGNFNLNQAEVNVRQTSKKYDYQKVHHYKNNQ
jgi:hypothetical protein